MVAILSPKLFFGIEIEIYVRPKPTMHDYIIEAREKNKLPWHVNTAFELDDNDDIKARKKKQRGENLSTIRSVLAALLDANGLRATDTIGSYDEWNVVDEDLDALDSENFWGVEFVSRVLSTSEPWQDDLTKLFEALALYVDLRLTDGCATHVHVSPKYSTEGAFYNARQLQGILKAAVLFDKAVDSIVPYSRQISRFAQSNVRGDTADKRLREEYNRVKAKKWKPVFRYIERHTTSDKIKVLAGNSTSKYTTWNFSNVGQNKTGTIEFRKPPGVGRAEDAKHWAAFTVAFIKQALSNEDTHIERYRDLGGHPSVKELNEFVESGFIKLESGTFQGSLKPERITTINY